MTLNNEDFLSDLEARWQQWDELIDTLPMSGTIEIDVDVWRREMTRQRDAIREFTECEHAARRRLAELNAAALRSGRQATGFLFISSGLLVFALGNAFICPRGPAWWSLGIVAVGFVLGAGGALWARRNRR